MDIAAQKLEVISLEDAVTDNTAWNPSTSHKLDDGRYCPVIKVEFNQPACDFEGGIFEGKKPVFKTNEYWVYMLPGARHLIIKHPNFDKIDIFFDEVNPEIVRLKEKHTYILKLKGEVKKGLESVEKGEAASMLKMAQNYENGTGTYSRNIEQALEWYEKAAEAGSIEAQEYLADVLYRGANGFTRHQEKAIKWNEVCAQRGIISCYLPLAELFDFVGQRDKTITWLRKHCEAKEKDGQQMLRLGKLIGTNNNEGYMWLRKASELGNKEATHICLQYLKKKPTKEIALFYTRAIDSGDLSVVDEYAQILKEGKYGIAKNVSEANHILETAKNTVLNSYPNYKCDNEEFQAYIRKIPQLLSRVKNGDIEAMITMLLIYRVMNDHNMQERMLVIIRYHLSQGKRLPPLFDFYLERLAKYEEMNYEKLIFGSDSGKKDYYIPDVPWVQLLIKEGYLPNTNKTKSYKNIISERGKRQGITTFTVNNVAFNMITIKGGARYYTFSNGWQTVNHNYLIGETEVTKELWDAVMGKGNYMSSQRPAIATINEWGKFLEKLCKLTKRKFRIPTQEEWVYAAQGGINRRGCRFSGSDKIDEIAWYADNASEPQDVAQKMPNELGIYDMSGNVIEYISSSNSANCAGGGLNDNTKKWSAKGRCAIDPYVASPKCEPNDMLGLRLALTELLLSDKNRN